MILFYTCGRKAFLRPHKIFALEKGIDCAQEKIGEPDAMTRPARPRFQTYGFASIGEKYRSVEKESRQI